MVKMDVDKNCRPNQDLDHQVRQALPVHLHLVNEAVFKIFVFILT